MTLNMVRLLKHHQMDLAAHKPNPAIHLAELDFPSLRS